VKENPNTVIVDSGNLTDGSGPQKLDIMASAMVKMGYAAVGVGDRDAIVGDQFYTKLSANKLAIVDTSPAANKSAVPFVLKTIGGVKVGILSFGVAAPNVTVDDMELRKARFVAFKEARAKSDVLILLDQAGVATRDWIDRNGPRFGAPDIVIGGVKHNGNNNEEVVARAHIMPCLSQAKEMGVIDLEVTPGQEPKVDTKRITLDEKYAEDPDILKQVNDGIQALGLPITPVPTPIPNGAVGVATKPYYSPNLCKACHLKQYEDWVQTKHAKALKTLVDGKNATPDCMPCHSERYRVARQYVASDNPIGGVECATCHVNSLPHGMERKQMAMRSKVQPVLCLQCHTKDRSPTYDEKTYFARVAHASAVGSSTASVHISH
jgi:predicted CXXCH cytochrome family protein